MNLRIIVKNWLVPLATIFFLTLVTAGLVNHWRPTPLPWNWQPAPTSSPTLTDPNILAAKLQNPLTVLVDAREPVFHKLGHIPGAVSLPVEGLDGPTLAVWHENLPPEAEIIIYCSDDLCPMADQLAQKMAALGLQPTVFTPGYAGWEGDNRPTESDLPAAGPAQSLSPESPGEAQP